MENMQPEGSRARAMEANAAAIMRLTKDMEELAVRADSGENVDADVRATRRKILRIKEDRNRL